MPYRVRAPLPEPQIPGLDTSFWAEKNTMTENGAVRAADTKILSGLARLATEWYRDTIRRYPKDYHIILHDLNQAASGRGTYLKVRKKSRFLVGVLASVADAEGWLTVDTDLFDLSEATPGEMSAAVKESAIRWSQQDPQIRRILTAAFASSSERLDPEFLDRYREFVPPVEVMEATYFRSVSQYDFLFFESPRLAQNLFFYLYD